jgi:filamentous hemagglutinin family protein
MKTSTILGLALATTALAPLGAHAAGPVLPAGGTVVAGSAVIGTPAGGSLAISQSSSKAIIDWTGFSIGQGGAVAFNNGKGATLNRVTGGSISSLDGLLTATGSVYVINPNGVIVGKSGVVNVGGTFVASTLDVSNANFLSGGPLSFMGASNAAVLNYGKIGALGGDVALIAAKVSNAGEIDAANGDAGLLAGYKVVLTDASLDQGRFAVELGGSGTSATNSGLIQAADAELRAEGGNVYALAGDTAGVIRATGVSTGGGHVWLVADGGTLDVAGTLEAQGAGGTAGSIETSGQNVALGRVNINAHGGTWSVDPVDLTIDAAGAATIDAALNIGTNVTESTNPDGSTSGVSGAGDGSITTPGNGDILVAAPISWSTTAALTLSAYRNIDVQAPITSSGGGALTLSTGYTDPNTGVPGAGAVIFNGGSVQFTGTAGSRPLGALNINGTNYTLVSNLATLAADITVNNSGAYALATSVDGTNSGAGYITSPLASTIITPFAGTFEGLGNTVTNLTINDNTSPYVGLFGQSTGRIQDVGLVDAKVSGTAAGAAVGALVGFNNGTLNAAYVMGQVMGGANASVGGLVGDNGGVMTGDYATGAVAGGSGADVGGLVGTNDPTGSTYYQPQIYQAYSTASVNGGPSSTVGGLVGLDMGYGEIQSTYATGAVSGGARALLGGLVGQASSNVETLTSFFDASTSGIIEDGVGGVAIAETTAQMQSGNLATTLAQAAGLYPYIASFYAAQPQALSGIAYSDAGINPLSSGSGIVNLVSGASNGVSAQASTGVNGYFYILLPAGPPSGSPALAYTTADNTTMGRVLGAHLDTLTGTSANFDVWGGALIAPTAATSVAGAIATAPTAAALLAANSGADQQLLSRAEGSAALNLSGLSGAGYIFAVGFTLDAATPTPATGLYAEATTGDITVNVPGGLVIPGGVALELVAPQGAVNLQSSIVVNAATGNSSGQPAIGGALRLLADVDSTTGVTNLNLANGVTVTYPTAYSAANDGGVTSLDGGTAGQFSLNGQNYGLVRDLAALSTDITNNTGGFYALAIDVDGSNAGVGYTQSPLASTIITPFSGTLEGLGHAVTNLTITDTTNDYTGNDYTGLLAQSSGTLRDIIIAGGSVSTTAHNVGALVGSDSGPVISSTSSASVTDTTTDYASANVGGLVGYEGALITTSTSSGAVSAINAAASNEGGLVGESTGTILNSSTSGSVTAANPAPPTQAFNSGSYNVGGLAGVAYQVTGSSSSANVAVNESNNVTRNSIGGLLGSGNIVASSFASGSVSASNSGTNSQGNYLGGLVGSTGSVHGAPVSVSDSYSSGSITGDNSVLFSGGLIGYFVNTDSYSDTVTRSHSSSNISAGVVEGGLIGYIDASDESSSIDDSFASGYVSCVGCSIAGGLIGRLYASDGFATVSNSYSTGPVIGDGAFVGGLIGAALTLANDNLSYTPITTLTITGDYASGAVHAGASSAVGGLIGEADAYFQERQSASTIISNSYALGSVTGGASSAAGGLIGKATTENTGVNPNAPTAGYTLSTSVDHSYATGAVTAGPGSEIGGLVGAVSAAFGPVSASYSYWDTQTTGLTSDALVATTTGNPTTGSIGLTSAQFRDATSPIAGLGLGATPGGPGFVIIDSDGTLNGSNGAIRPLLLADYSTSISNVDQLQLAMLAPAASYTLVNNIDASATAAANPSDVWGPAGFIPLGSGAAPFTGALNGAGYVISGLTVAKTGTYAGLIGALGPGGSVSNLTLADESISGAGYVGGLVGDNFGTLTADSTSGSVSGPGGVGGVVGVNEGGASITGAASSVAVTGTGDDVGGIAGASFSAIVNSASSGSVMGANHVGGLVGYNSAAVTGSWSSGAVTGTDYVGGLVGLNYGAITNSTTAGPVNGSTYVGGLVGWNTSYGTLNGDVATSAVTATGDYAGGLSGVNAGAVTASAASGSVAGVNNVGGLIGLNQGSIIKSNASSPTSGDLYVGGLVGWNDTGATVKTSYASGTVTGNAGGQDAVGDDYVGGLVGVNFGFIANTYATGAVSGVRVVGGLVGTNMPGATVATSYATSPVSASAGAAGTTFGVQAGEVTAIYGFPALSGQPVESGYVNAGASGDGTDLTTAQEDGSAAYAGFDFTNTWQSNPSGAPTLQAPPAP